MKKKWNLFIIPFLVASSYIFLYSLIKPAQIKKNNFPYTRILLDSAHNLLETGVFSKKRNINKIASPPPTRDLSPVLPFLIAGYATIDGEFRQALSCFVASRFNCADLEILSRFFIIQYIFTILGLMSGFYLAYLLSGSWHTAFLTMLLLMVGGYFFKYGKMLTPWVVQYFTIYSALIFLYLMHLKKNILFAFTAGIFLGVAALFESHFIFAIAIVIPLISLFLLIEKVWNFHESLLAMIAIFLGVGLIAGSWSLRNYQIFGDFQLNPAEIATALSERIAFNQMSWRESLLATFHYMPSHFGFIGDFFLSTELKYKLGMYLPDTYLSQGRHILEIMISGQKDAALWLSALANTYIFPSSLNHIVTSLPLFIQGLWGGGEFVPLAGLFFLPRFIKIHREKKDFFSLFLVFGFFLVFAFIFALITPASAYFNLPIIFIYCYVISYVVGCL